MKISYSILTHNEDESLQRLLEFLVKHKDEEDEIVILDDFSDNKKTKVPKVDLFDEENPGAKIEPIYNSIIKATLLNRRKDCYRTYSYASLKGSVEIVKFEFNVSPLKEIVNQDFKKLDKINRTTMYQLLRGNDGAFDEDKL